jgi:SWI/SNF-related matrix-associated actin-dependent regulator of chromatin subfamily A-like protein 1
LTILNSLKPSNRVNPLDLFPYQKEGAAFLASKRTALLADDPGIGKSAQAITAAKALNAKCVVVVCPASVTANWANEFRKFWPGFDGAVIRSYDMVVRHGVPFTEFDVLIIDEAHFAKSKDAKRTQALFGKRCDGIGGLVERAQHIFCLTGTPSPNHPAEIWPMLRALAPELIQHHGRTMAYWTFVGQFCRTEENWLGHVQIKGGKNLDRLKKTIAPFVLRRKKADVLRELPPIRFETLPLAGGGVDRGHSAEVKAIIMALERDGVEGLAALAPHVAQLRRATGLAKVGPAGKWILDQLDGGVDKLVVFAQHRDVLTQLRDVYPGSVMISGETPQKDRGELVDMFQRDPAVRLFVGQLQAAGTGITLTAASDLLFVESSWVHDENVQAAMRIHRIGQNRACLARFATLAGSIDERIQAACARKMRDNAEIWG